MGNRYDILTSEPSVNFPDYDYVLAVEEIIQQIEMIRYQSDLSKLIQHRIQYSDLKKLLEYRAFIKGRAVQYDKEALDELNTWLVSRQNSFQTDTDILDLCNEQLLWLREKISYDFVHAYGTAAENKYLKKLSNPGAPEDSINPMPTLQKIVEAWRAFHIARLMIVRTFNLHKQENGNVGENEDIIVDFPDNEDVIETIFVAASLTYLNIFVLVAINYYRNKEKLTELERARMQFEMWDAIVWFGINVFRLSGSGALNIDTQGQSDDAQFDLGMALEVNQSLLLFGYLFDLINQLIYDLRQLDLMNRTIASLETARDLLDPSAPNADPNADPNAGNRRKVYDVAIAEIKAKRDAFVRRSVFSNIFYALGLSSGAICNLAGAGSAGFIFAATPAGIALIFLSSFINQSKNWYVAIQDWKDVNKKCAKQHEALLELNKLLVPTQGNEITIDAINEKLINAGLCPLSNDVFKSPIEIRNYKIKQYKAITAEMHAANNKVKLYSFWFSMLLTSMTCLAFASTLIGLVIFVGGGLIYSGLKHTGLVQIEAPKNLDKNLVDQNSTSKMFLAYAKKDSHSSAGNNPSLHDMRFTSAVHFVS